MMAHGLIFMITITAPAVIQHPAAAAGLWLIIGRSLESFFFFPRTRRALQFPTQEATGPSPVHTGLRKNHRDGFTLNEVSVSNSRNVSNDLL